MTELAQSLCGKLYEVCRGTVRQKPIDLVKKAGKANDYEKAAELKYDFIPQIEKQRAEKEK